MVEVVASQLAYPLVCLLSRVCHLPGGEQDPYSPVLRPGDLLLSVPRRGGHLFHPVAVLLHLVSLHQALGSVDAVWTLLLSSFGRRLGEGRGIG